MSKRHVDRTSAGEIHPDEWEPVKTMTDAEKILSLERQLAEALKEATERREDQLRLHTTIENLHKQLAEAQWQLAECYERESDHADCHNNDEFMSKQDERRGGGKSGQSY